MSTAHDRKLVESGPASFRVRGDAGSIQCEWVAPGVLLTGMEGRVSAPLGSAFVQQLELLLTGRFSGIRYFIDTSELVEFDLLARSAIMRVLLALRSKFSTISILSGDTTRATAPTVAEALGRGAVVVHERQRFVELLRHEAPSQAHALKERRRNSPVSQRRGLPRGRSS